MFVSDLRVRFLIFLRLNVSRLGNVYDDMFLLKMYEIFFLTFRTTAITKIAANADLKIIIYHA